MARATLESGLQTTLSEAMGPLRLGLRRLVAFLVMLGLFAAGAGFAMVEAGAALLTSVPQTRSLDTLGTVLCLWALLLVVAGALGLQQAAGLRRLSRFVAGRLGVAAALALAQRAGRPEALGSAALEDLAVLRRGVAGLAARALVQILALPLLILLAFAVHWAFAVLTILFYGVAGLLSHALVQALRREMELARTAGAQAQGLAADAMRAGEAILAMGMLPRLAGHLLATGAEAAGEAFLARRRASRLRLALDAVLGLFGGAFLFLMAFLVLGGMAGRGAGMEYFFLAFALAAPFAAFVGGSREVAEAMVAWQRLRRLLAETPSVHRGTPFPCPRARLVAEHLTFGFRGMQPVLLRNVDLALEPGEAVAIVGPSGCGKSTLLRVLMGLYPPGAGGVYLDGHAVHQWDREDLARHVGFLPQQPLLGRGTVAEAIARLGTPDMALVLDAARRAGVHEAVTALPLGYATPVAGAWPLSMGQQHRLALARALYGRPRVLVLDELAGGLDVAGEAQVIGLLRALRQEGVAVVFTTHRPALVGAADRVLALRNGSLVPAGAQDGPSRVAAAAQAPRLAGHKAAAA
ncbi:ATP-binding cassette domain-containing protein [Belnapia sp. F-4-1]|uniref:ATP-binding cassette domain-containing protein n=1 Tax=Belnapia sp. F-4-1 TaxID=1545443 RepID=UPI00068DA40B|nr:ATP-binding cassette domain-containing protein [Belnapia sp. F-4-1]